MIQAIPIDRQGNLLFIKNFEIKDDKFFLDYRSMLNDIPFQRVEVYSVDSGQNIAITGNDGTVLYRFNAAFAFNVINDTSKEILEKSQIH